MELHREAVAVGEEAAVVEEVTNLELQDRSQPGPCQEAVDLEVN